MNNLFGKIDVVDAGAEGRRRFLAIEYDGNVFRIYQDRLDELSTNWKSDGYDSWFLNGEEVRNVFGDTINFYNLPVISGLINYIYRCVFDNRMPLPIRDIDVDSAIELCKNDIDFDNIIKLRR